MQKKIGFVIDNLKLGGTQKLTVEVMNCFSQNPDYDIGLLILNENPVLDVFINLLNKNIHIERINLDNYGFFSRIYKLSKLLKKYDLVHSCLELSNLYVSLASLVTQHAKFIGTFHGVDGFYIEDDKLKKELTKYGYKQKLLHTIIQNFALRFYSGYIAVSEATKKFLIEKRKLKSNKIKVIYHGINLNYDKENIYNREDLRKKFNIDEKDFVIGYFGRLSYAKGLENLFESFLKINTKHNNVKLLIIGEGELENYLRKYTIEKNINNKCIFINFQSNIQKYYTLIDLYILPSLSEGINLGLLEAMYNKSLVLSSDAGGSSEIVTDKYNGFLFPKENFLEMEEKILYIIDNYKSLQTLSENAHTTITDKFDMAQNISKIQNFFVKFL